MEKSKKMSLADFKAKKRNDVSHVDLAAISGGILGACHCVTEGVTYVVTYSGGGGGSSTYEFKVCYK